jgi:hypothetical protein
LVKLSRYVEFHENNFNCLSIEIARILLASAAEVDVVSKLLCKTINPKSRADNIHRYRDPAIETTNSSWLDFVTLVSRANSDRRPRPSFRGGPRGHAACTCTTPRKPRARASVFLIGPIGCYAARLEATGPPAATPARQPPNRARICFRGALAVTPLAAKEGMAASGAPASGLRLEGVRLRRDGTIGGRPLGSSKEFGRLPIMHRFALTERATEGARAKGVGPRASERTGR